MTAGPLAEVKDKAHVYFVDDRVLVRKWVPGGEFGLGSPV